MSAVIQAADGRMYYGARASWGVAEIHSDGLLHAVPLVPSQVPEWVRSAGFRELIATSEGVYFISAHGLVFQGYRNGDTQFYEQSRIVRAFSIGDRVYVSSFSRELEYVDTVGGTLKAAPPTELDHAVVEFATPLDNDRSLLSLIDGRLVVFDGQRLLPWEAQSRHGLTGRISAILHLVDDTVAVGITGRGLFLFSPDGELLLTLNTPEAQRITALGNREPGVLWMGTENGVEKVLYSSALTSFGQQLGLTLGWPIIECWQGGIYIASDGKLYQATEGEPGAPTRFEPSPYQPADGAWALAAWGPRMLIGTVDHIYSVEPDGSLRSVTALDDMAHLVMFDADHCYAIGRSEIALLEWKDGAWTETSPRTRGVTYPSVVHRVKNSVWIEMGGQVGRLWRREGQMQLDVVPNASWTNRPWINVGAVGDIVVLSGGPGERRFFDEGIGSWCEAPKLQRLLERSPVWIARVEKDDAGTIWATHDDGVVRFTPKGGDYEIDASSFDLINDRYPVLRVLPGNDVWIFASQSLYHVEQRWAAQERPALEPRVVSLVAGRGEELLTSGVPTTGPVRLPFAQNNPSFRFFAGSDTGRRAPRYEYRLTEREPWTPLAGSQLSFRGVGEGEYLLQVRAQDRYNPASAITRFPFEVLPPWYRTWPAYVLFGSAGAMLLLGITRWASYLERRRSRMLEQVVHERTRQLEETMARLSEETRNAATLAERDRLANEIHDSVQQGLTGAILQLDTTLKSPAIVDDVRSRLNVVRNMVSYARQEVQHAVWDMESPLLEGTGLAEALRNLTTFINANGVDIDVAVTGESVPLARAINHNLLRIAQEATTNAFRHAEAKRISIRLGYDAATVSLVIADDGIGFDASDVLRPRAGHLGLRGIRTRVKKLGGTLAIDSAPGRGTSINIVVPLNPGSDSTQDLSDERN
jgi:signal transduction histidine kinase